VKLYKDRLRDVVATGDLSRLESPYAGPRSAIDFVSDDKSRAVVFVYQHADGAAKPALPRGLDAAKRYRVAEVNLPAGATSSLPQHGQTLDGATLMRDGLGVTCARQCDSSVIELVAE
jgi:alpha-galactosidase